jgi:hypothetical protein
MGPEVDFGGLMQPKDVLNLTLPAGVHYFIRQTHEETAHGDGQAL